MSAWAACKNILCIRADNMGDLLMSTPAIRALKQFTNGKITVLTSTKAAELASLIPEIDAVITYDLPWIKMDGHTDSSAFLSFLARIKQLNFDACVIFTVYSQNPLPAALVAYLAGIPLRLAYCRENPYDLLSDWIPDPEPLQYIRHQVERDLDLVAEIGAVSIDSKLSLRLSENAEKSAMEKLTLRSVAVRQPYAIFHGGVSETKRMYSEKLWIECGVAMKKKYGGSILLTGIQDEEELTGRLQKGIGSGAVSIAGLLTLEEFISVINKAAIVLSVNTGTVHLAAAVETPVVVLYAQTNPQHSPWKVAHRMLEFSIPEEIKSRNEIIRYVDNNYYQQYKPEPTVAEIMKAVAALLPDAQTAPPVPG